MARLKKFWKDCYAAAQHYSNDDGSLLSASVAYYAALSFFPLLLILISGLGLFFHFTHTGQNAEQQILQAIAEQVSPTLASQVEEALRQVRQQAGVGGPLGLVVLLFTAMLLFAQFETAFHRIWKNETTQSPGWLRTIKDTLLHRFRAFLMILVLGLLLLVIFAAGFSMEAIQARSEDFFPLSNRVWWLVQTGVTIGLNGLVFTLIFRLLPPQPVSWGAALRGGMLTAVIWEIGRQILAAYVIGGRYTSAYGVVGSFIAIMLWIYYAVAVVFLGAEYVRVISAEPSAEQEE